VLLYTKGADMNNIKKMKKIYDKLGNDSIRSKVLTTAELLRVRKDILRMDTNNYCNIQCIMCNRLSTSRKKHYMALTDFISVIDLFAPTLRNLYLSCACEPLATPGFTEYLRYAKSKGIPFVSFCTNALAMNQKMIEEFVNIGADEIIISFNGFTRDDYHRIMPGSDFNKVCENINVLNACKKEHNTPRPQLRLNTILLKSNLLHLDELVEFVLRNDIDIVQFRELQLFDDQNNPEEVKKELLSSLSPQELKALTDHTEKAVEYIRSKGKEVILPLSFHNLSSQQHTTCVCQESNCPAKKSTCSIPFFSYWIDWKGDVRVCGYDEKGIIGNVYRDKPAFMKQQRKQFQKMAMSGECSSELCSMNIDNSEIN